MIITTTQELRLASPAHALDSIDGLVGFIDNSEHDFLEDKLGTSLYQELCEWYDDNPVTRSSIADYQTGYWNRLLLIAQRVVAFDALGRAIGMQAISVNNAGINQMIAEDYPAPDKNGKTIDLYRETCNKEAHTALNQLLRLLEQWCKENNDDEERKEIVAKWKKSRYYYLAASLLIPSCEVMQSYLNIYDSREKFIQMLPDLQFIQEEQITTSIGEDLMAALVDYSANGAIPDNTEEALVKTVIHRLRKVIVALLAGRTSVLKYNKEQKVQYHDDGVRMFDNVINYLRSRQQNFPEALVKDAPWYIAPAESVTISEPSSCNSPCAGGFVKEHSSGAAVWMPPLL